MAVSGISEWFRSQGLAAQVRAARERARSLWLTMEFATGMCGMTPRPVADALPLAVDELTRLEQAYRDSLTW